MEYYAPVIPTTFDPKLSQYVEFSGYLLDIRKRDMLPSAFLRANRNPLGSELKLTRGCELAAWISNERNKSALLSTWPVD